MAIDRDDRQVKDIRSYFEHADTWPDRRNRNGALYYKFTMHLADSLGDRELKLVSLSGSARDHDAAVQALAFMNGLIALCRAKLTDLYSNTDGEISELSGVTFIPWSSIRSVSRVTTLRDGIPVDETVDFDIELSGETIQVRHENHRNVEKASRLYNDLIDHLASRK